MIKLKSYSAQTNQGPYLGVNEDDHDIDIINNLYLIFDGFGGSNVGDRAVRIVKENIKKFYTKISVDPDSTMPFFYSYKYLIEGNALINAIYNAHDVLKKENLDKDLSAKGGASAICSCFSENIMTFVSVGNCVAYILRNGEIEKIIQPDSMKLLAKDNFQYHFQTVPQSGFGLFDDLHLHTTEVRIADGDLVIMMTDGSYSRLKSSEFCNILQKKDRDLSEKISEVFQLSNDRGNLDNQSCVLLQF